MYDVLYQLNIHNQLIIRSSSIKDMSDSNDDYVRLITEKLFKIEVYIRYKQNDR